MQSVLLNPEIVSSLVSYAYWGRNVPDENLQLGNVLALALTCRSFLEPALDQLWRRQLNIFNLVETLPADAWYTKPGEYVNERGERQVLIRTGRVLIPSDWARFDYYAAKIRELGYDPWRATTASSDPVEQWRETEVPIHTWMALCIVRLPCGLLPNIRRVRWTTHEYLHCTHIHVHMFLNASLVSLLLDFTTLELTVVPITPEPEPNEEDEGQDGGEQGAVAAAANHGGGAEVEVGRLGQGHAPATTPGDALPNHAIFPAAPPAQQPAAPKPPLPPVEPDVFEDHVYIKYTLKAILEQCPNFCHFELVAPQFERYRDAIAEFLRSAKSLRTFSVNLQQWQEDDLVYLARVPTLRKIRLYLAEADSSWLSRAATTCTPFVNVVSLILDVVSLECCTAFFIQWGHCRLEQLVITSERRPTTDVLHTFLSTLALTCSPTTLKAIVLTDTVPIPLCIYDSGITEAVGVSTAVTFSALTPLTSFTVLRLFELNLSGMYRFNNLELATLVSAWPYLETLKFRSTQGWRARSVLTIAGLAAVMQASPRIEQLCMAIDATQDDLSSEAIPAVRNKLRTIRLMDSYILEDPVTGAALARNLAAIFPDLENIQAYTQKPAGERQGADIEMRDVRPGHQNMERRQILGRPEADPGPEELQVEWLASREFWNIVEQQVATFALLRDMDIQMDLS